MISSYLSHYNTDSASLSSTALAYFNVKMPQPFVVGVGQNSNNPSYRRIYEHMERRKSFVSSMDEGVQKAREGNYAFIGESVSLDLAVARYCELVRAHEVIGMRGYSIVTTLGEATETFIKTAQ